MAAVLALADIAEEQWGLVTTAQAARAGQSAQAVARLARQGVLERLAHGVYRLAGAPAGPFDDLRAAWLGLEPGRTVVERLADQPPAVVSHRSAAQLLGLGDLDADRHEFTVPDRHQSRRADIRFHRRHLHGHEWTLEDGLPVTTTLRTIEDLAASQVDGGHLAGVVRDALTTGRAETDSLAAALRPHAHRYQAPLGGGHALLRRLLDEAGVPEEVLRMAELAALTDTPSRDQRHQDGLRRVLTPNFRKLPAA